MWQESDDDDNEEEEEEEVRRVIGVQSASADYQSKSTGRPLYVFVV